VAVRGIKNVRIRDAKQLQRSHAKKGTQNNEARVLKIVSRKHRQNWDIIDNVVSVVAPPVDVIEHNAMVVHNGIGRWLAALFFEVVVIDVIPEENSAPVDRVDVMDALPRERLLGLVLNVLRVIAIELI
jgi:hypothetical protein